MTTTLIEPVAEANIGAVLRQGMESFAQEDWAKALTCFDTAVRASPYRSDIHNLRACNCTGSTYAGVTGLCSASRCSPVPPLMLVQESIVCAAVAKLLLVRVDCAAVRFIPVRFPFNQALIQDLDSALRRRWRRHCLHHHCFGLRERGKLAAVARLHAEDDSYEVGPFRIRLGAARNIKSHQARELHSAVVQARAYRGPAQGWLLHELPIVANV
jgi:hypothetical protein